MFAAIHIRLCLSLIPVMLSIPFAWKVHETKIEKAIREKESRTKNFFEELEEADGMPAESSQFDYKKEEDVVVVDDNEPEEDNKVDTLTDVASTSNEEVADMNHFLGLNFGTDKRLTAVDLASVQESQSWFDIKLRELLCSVKELGGLFMREISDFNTVRFDIRSLTFSFCGLIGIFSWRSVISSCWYYGKKLFLFPLSRCFRLLRKFATYLKHLVSRLFARKMRKQKKTASIDGLSSSISRSLSNIKDPESMSPSTASVNNVCDQAAMFDEKKNFKGREKRKDGDASEWLESSFIEGGIQTYSMIDCESTRSNNRTEDYLQFTSIKTTDRGRPERVIKDPPRTSTPKKMKALKNNPESKSQEVKISSTYSPKILRNFLYNKCERQKGLELTFGLSKLAYSQFIAVDEQKKLEKREQSSLNLNYFVNSTKDKIRRRLTNMSYV